VFPVGCTFKFVAIIVPVDCSIKTKCSVAVTFFLVDLMLLVSKESESHSVSCRSSWGQF